MLFLVFFKGFDDVFQFIVCLFLHLFGEISHFLFKCLKHFPEVIFKSFSSALSIFGSSSLAIVGSLDFTGVVLFLWCCVCSYPVYSSFLLIVVVGAVLILVINPVGPVESRLRWLFPKV